MSEFKFPAVLNEGNGKAVVTAFNAEASSPVFIADEFHPHFESILAGLRSGDPNVWSLFDVAGGVVSRFKEVTDRVSWNGQDILWDGDPVHTALADQLGRAIQEGDERNYTAIAKFWEKLESNPNQHSREQAYDFLSAHQFQITEDGDIVGYKGLVETPNGYRSWHASTVPARPSAFVNGVPQPESSHVYQGVGDVVSMPRSEVDHDPGRHCSRGLHVATQSYAEGYGNVFLVTVNPRDIVSVPNDASGEKVRVCRYKVEGPVTNLNSESVVLRDEPQTETRWTGVGYSGI